MKKVGRKVVSVLLTLCMLLTMLPVSALAVDEGTVDTAPAESTPAETTPAETPEVDATPVETAENVAQIGDQTYPTLEAAFAAVGSEAVTIKLLADTQISNMIVVAEGETIVLDLNGCAVTVPAAGSDGRSLYAINNKGTLTICDNSTEQDGSITARGIQNIGNGILTINSGTFISCDANGGAAVWNEATAYINGGTFKTVFVGSASDNYGPGCLNNSGTAVITAGTFESVNKRTYAVISTGTITITPAEGKEVIVSGAHGGLAVDSGVAVVNGGSFSSTEYYGLYVSNDGQGEDPMQAAVTVNGGTFTGANYSVWIGSDYNNPVNSTIAIHNGIFMKPLNAQSNTREGAVQVYGGTFYQEVPPEYCAEGFVPQKNADGTWGVVKKKEAEINGKQYATLSEALNKVQDGETIKVLAPATVDMAETYEITGKAITLYLNGQTVTWNTSAKEAITVKDGGSLTIQDTSANEAGELAFTSTYTAAGDSTGIYVNPNGALTLQSGTISYTAAKSGRAIYVGVTGTFAMSGGTVKIAGSAKYGVYLSSNNSTNITGGEIILSDTLTGTTLYGLYVYMPADAQGLAIENLTVDASAVPVAQRAYCISGGWDSANNAPVTISGGTYTTNENTLSKVIYYSTVKNLTISGGTFNGVVDSATSITDGTFQKAVKVTDTITGGTFEGKVTAPSGKISGGKFKVVNPPYYWNLADGKSFEQKDGYYCVVDDTSGVAQIGNKKYETLEAAITAAQNGETVKLIADVTMQDGILLDKGADIAITLDLNGYTYTVQEGANVSNRGFKINSGTLNVIDSSEAKTGEMVAVGSGTTSTDGAGAYGVFRVEANGHLNVTDVTLRNSRPWGLNVKICGGTATLTNVEIISSYGGGIEVTEANLGEQSQKGQATMTNCTVTQTGYFDHCSSAVSVSGGSKLIVNGGTYTSDGVAIYVFSSGGEIEVIDGTFSGKKQVIRAEIDTSTYPEYTGGVQIKGGSYTGDLAITSPASLAISGGTFSVEISEEYCAEGFKPVKNEQDNTWGVVEDTTIFESGSGTAEDPYIIMNATQLGRFRDSVNEGTNYQGQYIKLGADIDLSGMNWTPIGTSIALAFKGTFDGGDYVIENLRAVNNLNYGNGFFGNIVGPTAVIKNVTFDRAYVSRYSNNNIGGNIYGVVAAYAYGTVSFENVHVKNSDLRGYGKVAPILGMAADASGTTYLKDCTVENTTVYAVYNAAGLIGLAQNTVDLDNCTTTGVTGVLCDQPSSYVDLDVIVNNTYGGTQDKVQGKYLVDTTSLPGVTLYYAAWSDLYNDYYYGSLDGPCYIVGMDNHAIADGFCHNAQAQIGETKYATLADAIAAAGDNDTITLLADVTEDVVVPAGKTITLDLNGYKITNAADHTIVNNGTLTITDSSEAKTGTVDNIAHGHAAIYNNGTMTIEAGTYTRSLETQDYVDDGADNSWYTVVNDGTMTINGGTFTTANGQPENLGNRSSLVRNGDDATSNTGVTLTITGGQFISGANVIKNEQGSVIASISGGTFTMDNSQIAWYGGNNVIQTYGTITSITGGTFKALGDGTPIDQDNRYYRHGIGVYGEGKIENIGGTVSFEMKGSQNRLIRCDDTGSINITGGTYELADREGNNNVLIYKGDETAKIAISGGTFSDEPDDAYLVDGYAPEQNTDGDWVVVEKAFVAEIDGGQKYESLIEAVNVAKESGQTVKLLANVENLQAVEGKDYAMLIDNGQSMTLDLNGHKITAEFTNTEGFDLIKNYGELTITDTSEGKGGSIEVTENGSDDGARTSVIYNVISGKFTLEAGTLKLTGSADSKKTLYGVYSSGIKMVMDGGAIEVRRLNSYSEYSESWDVYGIYNGNNCQTTVNGGKITVENQGRYNSAYGINNASGTVSIHGDPNTPYIEANAFDEGTWYEHTLYGNITLYGGKYNMLTDTATGWIETQITIADGYEKKFNGDRTVSIVKSPVAQIGSTKYDTLEEALKKAKSGDTIKLLQNVALTDQVIISKNITLNLNDKTISSKADYAFIVNTGNSFTLENGTLSASKNGVFGFKGSTITLASDAKITAAGAGILATNSKADEGNATINVYGTIHSQDIAVWSQGPKNTINIDSATITSNYFGVYQNGSYGGTTITIKDSSITDSFADGAGVYVANNGTNAADPDQGLQKLTIENSKITGSTAVEVKFTDVIICGDQTVLEATGEASVTPNNSGSVTQGYALAVTHNGTESSKDAAKGTVTISGGKFTGAVGIQEPSEGETTSATISISGGSFSEEPNKDYLAPYYAATQNTTGDNYWTVDVAANIEAIWITEAATKPGMLSDLLTEATSGTVQLLKDVEAGNVTSTYPVTLDLNGNTLETTALALFDGAVVDSTEGEGLLKVGVTRNTPNITLKENNPSLFIYDSEAAGYRLYSYTFEKLRAYTTDQSGNSMGFYFQLTFENLAAWGKLNTAETTHGVIMSTVLGLPNGTELIVYFDQSTIQGVAGSIVGGAAQTGKGFWLTVTGLNKLEAGQTLKVTPTLEAAGDNLVINTEAFEYSKSADESN